MAKPISKNIDKTLKKTTAAVKQKVSRSGTSTTKKLVTGAAVAGAAGIAASALLLSRRGGRETMVFHVAPEGDDAWVIQADGSNGPAKHLGPFSTKKDALEAGRTAAAEAAPSRLVIHRKDGSVMTTHGYDRE